MEIKINCPECKALILGFKTDPKAGDHTVCYKCTEILVFSEDLSLKVVSGTELNNIPPKRLEKLLTYKQNLLTTRKKPQ